MDRRGGWEVVGMMGRMAEGRVGGSGSGINEGSVGNRVYRE